MTSKVIYHSGLSTTATHLRSGNSIITDAPVDNNGKGQAFSPTDLMATSLASCMMTIMGILAEKNEIDIDGTEADVLKIMAENPRRVAGIHIQMTMPAKPYSEKEKSMLSHAALNCPVMKSIHPDVDVQLHITWQDV